MEKTEKKMAALQEIGELSEENLDTVAGGLILHKFLPIARPLRPELPRLPDLVVPVVPPILYKTTVDR